MPHEISFKSEYKSIIALDTVELPDFVVLSGINGSGKSHLLEALENGAVLSSAVKKIKRPYIRPHEPGISLFTWISIAPQSTGQYEPRGGVDRKNSRIGKIREFVRDALRNLKDELELQQVIGVNEKITAKLFTDLLDNEEMRKRVNSLGEPMAISINYNSVYGSVLRRFAQDVGLPFDEEWTDDEKQEKYRSWLDILFMDTAEIAELPYALWGETSLFRQSFSEIFGAYRTKFRDNAAALGFSHLGVTTAEPLSIEDFEELFGPPPWELINEILTKNNLDFEIDKPSLTSETVFRPTLRKKSTKIEVPFEDLSSGEKVLISFVSCLFNGTDGRQRLALPQVLLFDEIDAPLHPSMTRGLLQTIKEILVDKLGIKVILTTHSPTTVALADKDCLFRMNPTGPSVEKVRKDVALNMLTAGVPTLAISYEGRRQVFVESQTDAALFSALYESYKDRLNSERSLSFLPVGKNKIQDGKETEVDSGCARVKQVVKSLRSQGVDSIFGLIDWDTRNKSEGGVFVLSTGVRYSVENLILDPVLLTLTLVRSHRNFCAKVLKLQQVETTRAMDDWPNEVWQTNIDLVSDYILDRSDPTKKLVQVTYLRGMTLNLDTKFLTLRGHDLEEKVLDRLKPLEKPHRKGFDGFRENLLTHIVTKILPEYPDYLPKEALDVFETLLADDMEQTLDR